MKADFKEMTMIRLMSSIVVAMCLAACQGGGGGPRASALRSLDLSAMIALDEAVAIAQPQVPNGAPVGAVLEVEDDDENEPPAWEVSFFVAGMNQVISVEVHAHTGAVLEVEVEDDEPDDD